MRQNSNTSSEHRNISLLRVFGQLLLPFPGYKLFATLLHGVEFPFQVQFVAALVLVADRSSYAEFCFLFTGQGKMVLKKVITG
jgi:hypothetical protein